FELDKEEFKQKIAKSENLDELYKSFLTLKMRADFNFFEPSKYDEIIAASDNNYTIAPMRSDPSDYFYGAWLGRCIGCAVGQPVELWDYKAIREWYKNAKKYPVNGFVPTHSGENVNNGAATDEKINSMPEDDDIRFTVLALKLLKSKGFDFDTYDVGANWVYTLPFRAICTAENQAYLNFCNVDEFGPWGKPENAMEIFEKNNVNTYLNPYREWIGAQIRIDGYAYAAAGNPRLAAKLAHTDAYLSHTKNGIYGAMFFAAMISAAFAEKNVDYCFRIALTQIPKNSRFYKEMLLAESIALSCKTDDEFIERINNETNKYSFVHAINNSAICVGAILYADGDFKKAVTLSVAAGMDTDCNGATVGSFMGALVGGKNIPSELKDPLNDTFYCGLSPYHPGKISEFAKEYEQLYKKLC
ncbi:MAG: ADP-ribosylglycohydrolase family protein, partial [Clostridia bacterium]